MKEYHHAIRHHIGLVIYVNDSLRSACSLHDGCCVAVGRLFLLRQDVLVGERTGLYVLLCGGGSVCCYSPASSASEKSSARAAPAPAPPAILSSTSLAAVYSSAPAADDLSFPLQIALSSSPIKAI
jgi:hypothetical protein